MNALKIRCHGIDGYLDGIERNVHVEEGLFGEKREFLGYTIKMWDIDWKRITFDCVKSFELIDEFSDDKPVENIPLLDY